MANELTWWVSPFTTLASLDEAISLCKKRTPTGWHPNLLLPTHYGPWPQSECRQTLPPDMRVASPDNIAPLRSRVEAAGVGFGSWGVPVDLRSPELAAGFAGASGYYSANFEPAEFWTPGDNPAAIDAWWGEFWNTLGDNSAALDGNTSATVVPNSWGTSAFATSLPNLAAGCSALVLETYGGRNTARSYAYPNLWPIPSFALMRQKINTTRLVPILARANLASQLHQANVLSPGRVEVWYV